MEDIVDIQKGVIIDIDGRANRMFGIMGEFMGIGENI